MNKTLDETASTHRRRRQRRERVFALCGIASISFTFLMLILLIGSVTLTALPALRSTSLAVVIERPIPDGLSPRQALARALQIQLGLEGGTPERRQLLGLFSPNAADLYAKATTGSEQKIWLPASDDVDQYYKYYRHQTALGRINELQQTFLNELERTNAVKTSFNTNLFFNADSRNPDSAGIRGALIGSFWTMLVTFLVAFPLGVLAAVYLEEFAKKGRLAAFLEININNLVAVPSVVYGLLGLFLFLQVFSLPRSAALVGGLVLALMTMPIIVIATRAALRSVPATLRQAAQALGANQVQVAFHHVVPYALPGIMTGTIIGMARALGETAPLLMIGMVAFIADVPGGLLDPTTVLPVQIFLWADSPERAFAEKTAAAILVLLLFLLVMNAAAIYLRKKFERKW
ncbi:MAG: phosphate ABC transporter permease PstA [Holosporales bacterium]|jgi:phosphate transport system permease protein